MQMTIDDLTKLYIPENFGTDEDDCGDTLDDIISQITCEYAYGVSKFVIFMNDKEVAKIPFNGEWYWYHEEDDLYFEPFEGITDYCKLEADIYAEAVDRGLGMFFAGTRFAGYTKDHTPFYVSERMNRSFDEVFDTVSEESIATARKYADTKDDLKWRRLSDRWLAIALEKYGQDLVDKFVKFVAEFDINDLHCGNLAVRDNGEPVIIDYSGWHNNN